MVLVSLCGSGQGSRCPPVLPDSPGSPCLVPAGSHPASQQLSGLRKTLGVIPEYSSWRLPRCVGCLWHRSEFGAGLSCSSRLSPWGFLVISGFAVGVEHAGGRERGGWCEAFCARWGGGLRSMFCIELAVIPGPKEALSSGRAVDPVQAPVHA